MTDEPAPAVPSGATSAVTPTGGSTASGASTGGATTGGTATGEATTGGAAPGLRWRDGVVPVLFGWVWARLCIGAGHLLSERLYDVLDHPRGPLNPSHGLLTWDGQFYLGIATGWYDGVPEDGARFFPLYPALARALTPLLGGREDLALLLLSNVTAALGALVLWRLVAEVIEGRDGRAGPGGSSALVAARPWWSITGTVSDRSAWMVAIAPAGFAFCFAYTEGLALLLVAATLLALHRRAFAVAGLLALAAAMLRPVGGLLLLPIAIELFRARPRPSWWVSAVALVGPVAGLGLALGWIAAATGDITTPLTAQSAIRGGFQDPITRVLEPIGELVKGDFRDTYNLAFMVVLLPLTYVAYRRRQPLSWIAYAVATLLVTLSSQVTDSLGRYALVVVPFIVALAQWADVRWRQLAVFTISSVGLIWLTSEAFLGRMVP